MKKEKKKKNKFAEGDDGRTVAKMNVDGMPWYVDGKKEETEQSQMPPLSKEDKKRLYSVATLAALAVVAVFGICAALFILFCQYVWLK